ncbi:MAG: hypothetical protein A2Y24_06485 [Clostridiales bacterium GWE2_32_10]|nr:MAG: hypothetical protein A2Y24_06485 [Clostridiales bacterium GWE2_32_10]HBY20842.1 hypothetical protein [Clostridiales bacterium]
MNIEKVEEVLESKGAVNVEYNGIPVWILDIDRTDNTVLIEGLEDRSFQNKVDARDLVKKD